MASPLANKILPSRTAAKRASANFAEQLESSDEEYPARGRNKKGHSRSKSRSKPDSRPRKRPASPVSDETDISISSQPNSSVTSAFALINQTIPDEEPWSLVEISDYAYIFINADGQPYSREQDSRGYIWWPVKVLDKAAGTIKVNVFGTLKKGLKDVFIINPSKVNIISFLYKHRPRFYPKQDAEPSPRKKSKQEPASIEERWAAAVRLAVDNIHDDDDGVPDIGIALSGFSHSRYRKSQDNVTITTSGAENSDDEYLYDIEPFTIVYAHGRHNRADYWPARVLECIKGKRKKPRYRVQFVDNTEELIPREWFYLDSEDGFGLCQLGKFDTQALDDPDDVDDDELGVREPSPSPLDPPPTAGNFYALSIREQFSYVKPVLQAILNKKYKPARAKHDAFMAGGKLKDALRKEAGMRGFLAVQDTEQLHKYLIEWCLRPSNPGRESVKANSNSDDHNVAPARTSPVGIPPTSPNLPSSSHDGYATESTDPVDPVPSEVPLACESYPAPQHGCTDYEALAHIEKLNYVLDVLLLEAKRQILLWREGLRTSTVLLNDEEEQELYAKGQELLERTDWVRDAQRLRASKERRLQKAGKLIRKNSEPRISDRALRAAARI